MNTESSPIKVVIIEDKEQIRNGLSTLINGTDGFKCTGSFGSMEDALTHINPELASVVLVDIGLPKMSGIEGIRRIKKKYPDLLCVVLSVYEDDQRIFEALCAGASGYLLKKTPPARLLDSMKEVITGGAPMSPEVATRVLSLFREIRPPENAEYQLTPHELRILKLFVEGHSYKSAAEQLEVSVNTISFHMKNIYQKLHVHSKSEAVAKALRDGLIH
jgi:DNA-binding NarL/FixJ family response regulator